MVDVEAAEEVALVVDVEAAEEVAVSTSAVAAANSFLAGMGGTFKSSFSSATDNAATCLAVVMRFVRN